METTNLDRFKTTFDLYNIILMATSEKLIPFNITYLSLYTKSLICALFYFKIEVYRI